MCGRLFYNCCSSKYNGYKHVVRVDRFSIVTDTQTIFIMLDGQSNQPDYGNVKVICGRMEWNVHIQSIKTDEVLYNNNVIAYITSHVMCGRSLRFCSHTGTRSVEMSCYPIEDRNRVGRLTGLVVTSFDHDDVGMNCGEQNVRPILTIDPSQTTAIIPHGDGPRSIIQFDDTDRVKTLRKIFRSFDWVALAIIQCNTVKNQTGFKLALALVNQKTTQPIPNVLRNLDALDHVTKGLRDLLGTTIGACIEQQLIKTTRRFDVFTEENNTHSAIHCTVYKVLGPNDELVICFKVSDTSAEELISRWIHDYK